MNITSLLQEAPSRDRTRRKQTSWEENGPEKTTSLEELAPQSLLDGTIGTANKMEFPQLYYPKQPTGANLNPVRPEDDNTNETKSKELIEQTSSQKGELASNTLLPPRTPSPALDSVHLGIYIYPSLPFPIHPSSLPLNRRTTLTVLVPTSLLPHHHNATSKAKGIYTDSRAHRLWGGLAHLYTDDSDVVFAALHSGTIPDDQDLFSSGKDLKLVLRVYPAPEHGHFVGGAGAAGLTSASWGNAHEGCAYKIEEATWVPPSTARSYTRQTRKARMAEYATRRAAIMNSQSTSFLLMPPPTVQAAHTNASDPSASLPLQPEMHPIEEEMASLSVMGGWRTAVGFKYNPVTLYLMLFAFTSRQHGPRGTKRRKLEEPVGREVILESSTLKERIVLVPKPPLPQIDPGTMELDGPSDHAGLDPAMDAFMRYDMYRETLQPPELIKPKGVRFAEGVGKEEENWGRTLLHENLGHDDVLFTPEFLLVGEERYGVDTWRWKGTVEDGKRAEKLFKTKKRGMVKRRKLKKVKEATGAAAEAAPAVVEPFAVVVAPTEPSPKALLPVDVSVPQEDREEGELSDETPAAT